MLRLAVAAAVSIASTQAFPVSASAPLSLVSTTPLPKITGGDFDHFAVDLARSRLYVSAEKYGSIEVFHLPDGRHIASVKNVSLSPHKIQLANNGSQLMVADAGNARLEVIDTNTFAVTQNIALQPRPDSGILDERTHVFYVGNGETITLISSRDKMVLGEIKVPAQQIKGMAIDYASDRLFVNFRDLNRIGVIDLKTNTLSTTWPVPGPSRNSAMAFDSQTNRLFIGSRAPGVLWVLDAKDGHAVQSLKITDVSDEIAIQHATGRIFVAGEGGLDVVQQNAAGEYGVIQHVDTRGGKTFAWVPEFSRLYVVHTKGPDAQSAGLQIFSVD